MGSVYLGCQLAVDRLVAVKLLHKFLQAREDFRERFELEAKALAKLSHPNCLTIFDFGYDAGLESFYMVVEYVDGDDLASRMHEALPVHEAAGIGFQISEALQHAHAQGILHRDLKPENVMLSGPTRSMVKVLDFGLAKLFDAESAPAPQRRKQLTKAGEIFGTPAYMSPEQCQGSRNLTPAADLYALGVILFEMLEGYMPFHAKSPPEVMLMQINAPIPPVGDHVPEELAVLVRRLLAKSPAERPQSAAEVSEVLHRYLEDLPSAARSGEFAARTVLPPAEAAALGSESEHKPTVLAMEVPEAEPAGLEEVSVGLTGKVMRLSPLTLAAVVLVLILAAAGTWFVVGLVSGADPKAPAAADAPVKPKN